MKESNSKIAICILGMHRSGTSALAGLVETLGFNFGNALLESSFDNPRGYYENKLVLRLNEAILDDLGFRWDTISALPYNWKQSIAYDKYLKQAIDILISEFGQASRIALKDPRFCFLFPLWEEALRQCGYKIKLLHTVRPSINILQSLKKRNGFDANKSKLLIIGYWLSGLALSRDYSRLFVAYEVLLQKPRQVAQRILDGLHLSDISLNLHNVDFPIEASLQHHKGSFSSYSTEKNTVDPIDKLLHDVEATLSILLEDSYAQEVISQLEDKEAEFSQLVVEHKSTLLAVVPFVKVLFDVGEDYTEKDTLIEYVPALGAVGISFKIPQSICGVKVLLVGFNKSIEVQKLSYKLRGSIPMNGVLKVAGIKSSKDNFVLGYGPMEFELVFNTLTEVLGLSFHLGQPSSVATTKMLNSNSKLLAQALFSILAHPIKFLKVLNLDKLRILRSALRRESPKHILRNFRNLLTSNGGAPNKTTDNKPMRKPTVINRSSSTGSDRVNVLFVTGHLPHTEHSSGDKRTIQILDILSDTFDVYVFSMVTSENYDALFDRNNIRILDLKGVKSLARNTTHIYAIVYSHYFTFSDNVFLQNLFPESKRVIDSVDLHWVREERSLGIWDGVTAAQITKNKKRELAAYSAADLIWVVSEQEVDFLRQELPESEVAVVSNIHIPTKKSFVEGNTNQMLFVGSFDHYPNISAVEHIVGHILPLIHQEIPEALFVIAGRRSKEKVGHLASEQVKVLGAVTEDALSQLYSEAVFSLVPLSVGAGVKGKVTESIYNYLPVITNDIGNEGIGLEDGISGLLGNTDQDIVCRAVMALRSNYDLEGLSKQAYISLSNSFSKETAQDSILSSLLPRVTICIVTHNKVDILRDCIASIIRFTTYPNYKICVYSNGCTDGTQTYLKKMSKEHKRLSYVFSETNDVFVKPNNHLFDLHSDSDIVMLNNDTLVTKSWLSSLFTAAYNDSTVGIVGSKLLNLDGTLQEFGAEIFEDGSGINYGRHDDEPNNPLYSQVVKVPYVSGCSMYIKRSTISIIGSLDEDLHPCYYEDSDFCYRAWTHNIATVVTPHSLVYHIDGATAGKSEDGGFKAYQAINRDKFIKKHKTSFSKVKTGVSG